MEHSERIIALRLGDCANILKTLANDSVDSLVTDPPAGISFMGKNWDADKGGRVQWTAWLADVMRECLRVLKPGAHGLVWALPRTSHWTATALEDAGFEVRDVITHHFGTGFPKSLDISKAIDKAAGMERPVIRSVRRKGGGTEYTNRANARQGYRSGEYQKGENVYDITAPATAEAQRWQGWGTALKPASEHWILCRKPLSERTVAANVLKWGAGGIGIDVCRVGSDTITTRINTSIQGNNYGRAVSAGEGQAATTHIGRFPANVILSHHPNCNDHCVEGCPVKLLDEQSGHLRSGTGAIKRTTGAGHEGNAYGAESRPAGTPMICYGDSGSACRFFYVAKASKKDRGKANAHPTVKSTALMEYLIRLVTPPDGTVLDVFMGSGSTGVAAVRGGWGFIGIERETEYFRIAEERIVQASVERQRTTKARLN